MNVINKTMDRSDLLTDEAEPIVDAINNLIQMIYSKKMHMTSWYGSLPYGGKIGLSKTGMKNLLRRILQRNESKKGIGIENRGLHYKPLPNAVDDDRIPWYLYWEIYWVIKNGPRVNSNSRVLDAGGTSSLFSCYLASLGCEVHSVDLNEGIVSNGNRIAKAMKWNMHSYAMNMKKLEFEDGYFDHAYSICVFEHLDYAIKQSALLEIARCLKPEGVLSITFDYRNPAPAVVGYGPDTSKRNQLQTKEDIERSFLATGRFELLGNQEFYDNQESYLVNKASNDTPYTFGSLFLRKTR